MIRLYRQTEQDATTKMLRDLELTAMLRGLAVGRWDYHVTKNRQEITYIVYSAAYPRASQGRHQQGEKARWELAGPEGKTERSAAYKGLRDLLRAVAVMPPLKGECAHCGATGFEETVDWVPYGSGDVPMKGYEPCPVCLGAGRCPRCGEVMDEGAVENLEACDKCGHKLFEEVAR